MDVINVWYDRKRGCLVSNVAFVISKRLGIPAQPIAIAIAAWLMAEHPELVERAWVS